MKIVSNVRDTTSTTGTGNITLAASLTPTYRQFSAVYSTNTESFPYVIRHTTADEWEEGIGYLSAATTLVRERVLASSNSNALVNFSAGDKEVYVSIPGRLAEIQMMSAYIQRNALR